MQFSDGGFNFDLALFHVFDQLQYHIAKNRGGRPGPLYHVNDIICTRV